MSDFREQLIRLGKADKSLRPHIRPVLAALEGQGRQASDVEIIIDGIDKMVVEDDHDQGEVGPHAHMDVARNVGTVRGIRGLMQALGKYGLPTDPREYRGMDSGRLTVGIMETEDGSEVDNRDLEAWRQGFQKLYRADYSIYVKFARTWKPNPSDMKKALGILPY